MTQLMTLLRQGNTREVGPSNTPPTPLQQTLKKEEKKGRREEGKNLTTVKLGAAALEKRIVKDTTEWFIALFNEKLGRQYRPHAWEASVAKAVKAGYGKADMMAALYCADTWADEMKENTDPNTLLRLSSRDGKPTLPMRADEGRRRWAKNMRGKTPPWERFEEVSDGQ